MLMNRTAIKALVTAFRTRTGDTSRRAPSAPVRPPIPVIASSAGAACRPNERNSSNGGEILTSTPRTSTADVMTTKTPRTAPAMSPTTSPNRTRCQAANLDAEASRGSNAAR